MGVPYAEVIGDPIAHSKSPLIHKFWLGKLGIEGDYRAVRIAKQDLPAYLEERRRDPLWCGANVTLPNKQVIVGHLDSVVAPANTIGAVNAITRTGKADPKLICHNTDALGFLDTIRAWPAIDRTYRQAKLIGTGGAAAAVAWALARLGFLLIIYSRSDDRGAAFQRRFATPDIDFVQPLESLARDAYCDYGERSNVADMIVNATPLGMRGFPPLIISLSGVPRGTLVYDLIYDPVETPLLKAARDRGLSTISGIEMLIAQAARAFELFFFEAAPRRHDAELRELLTR